MPWAAAGPAGQSPGAACRQRPLPATLWLWPRPRGPSSAVPSQGASGAAASPRTAEERDGAVSATAYVLPTVLCAVGGFGAQVLALLRDSGLPPWFDAACAAVQAPSWSDLDPAEVCRGEAAALRHDPGGAPDLPPRERSRLCLVVVADLRAEALPAAEAPLVGSLLASLPERLRAEREGIHRDTVMLVRGPVPAPVLAVAAHARFEVLQVTDTDCQGRVWDESWVVKAAAHTTIALVAAGLPARSEWDLARGGPGGARAGCGCHLEAAETPRAEAAPRVAALVSRGARAILGFSPERLPRPEEDARRVLAHFPPRLQLSDVPRHADILRHRSTHLARIGRGQPQEWRSELAAVEAFLGGPHLAWVAQALAELAQAHLHRNRQALDEALSAYAHTFVRPTWMMDLCDQVRRQVLAEAPPRRPGSFVAVAPLQVELERKLAERPSLEAGALLTAVAVLFVAVFVRLFAPPLLHGLWLLPLILLVLAPLGGWALDEWRLRQNLRALRDAVHEKYRGAEELLRVEAEERVRRGLLAAVAARKAALVAYAQALEAAAAQEMPVDLQGLGLRPDTVPPLDPLRTEAPEVIPALRRWAEGLLDPGRGGPAWRPMGREAWLAIWDQATPLVSPPVGAPQGATVFQLVPDGWRADPPEGLTDGGDGVAAVLRWRLPVCGAVRLLRWSAAGVAPPGGAP